VSRALRGQLIASRRMLELELDLELEVLSSSRVSRRGSQPSMMDILYLALTVVLFSLTWGLVRLCEHV
jgi:hypothetical protein